MKSKKGVTSRKRVTRPPLAKASAHTVYLVGRQPAQSGAMHTIDLDWSVMPTNKPQTATVIVYVTYKGTPETRFESPVTWSAKGKRHGRVT